MFWYLKNILYRVTDYYLSIILCLLIQMLLQSNNSDFNMLMIILQPTRVSVN